MVMCRALSGLEMHDIDSRCAGHIRFWENAPRGQRMSLRVVVDTYTWATHVRLVHWMDAFCNRRDSAYAFVTKRLKAVPLDRVEGGIRFDFKSSRAVDEVFDWMKRMDMHVPSRDEWEMSNAIHYVRESPSTSTESPSDPCVYQGREKRVVEFVAEDNCPARFMLEILRLFVHPKSSNVLKCGESIVVSQEGFPDPGDWLVYSSIRRHDDEQFYAPMCGLLSKGAEVSPV